MTAEEITFTVEDTGKVQKVEMKDDVTKVEISKTDADGKELPGAVLVILDEEGKEVERWTSKEKAHYMEMLPIGTYILREEKAPEGYLLAKDVKFEVKDTKEVQKVTMVDEKEPEKPEEEPPTNTPSDAPKTGDETQVGLWFALLLLGIGGLVAVLRVYKQKE